jgi:hypothetical protein
LRSSQEADVFVVHVDVQKAADFALLIAQVRLQVGELLVKRREEFSEIGGRAGNSSGAGRVPAQCGWDIDCNGHVLCLHGFLNFRV